MLSKSKSAASSVAVTFLLTSCSSLLPWHNERVGDEVNVSFTVQNNLLFLTSATIDGHRGRYFFGSAESRSVVDPRLVQSLGGTHEIFKLQLGDRVTLPFSPVSLDLGRTGDAIIGADVWGTRAVTIDYRAGLLIYQKSGMVPAYMALFRYDAEPAVDVTVDGETIGAVLDTALPDTLVLPRANAGRGTARIALAGTNFGNVDVKFANVSRPRVGNRLLSKFLVSIDYGKHVVGLWRDPRIP